MSYKNRDLVRKPICMLRGSKEEYEKLTSLALRLSNGGAVAPTLLDLLLKLADEEAEKEVRLHEANASRGRGLDRNVFGALIAA